MTLKYNARLTEYKRLKKFIDESTGVNCKDDGLVQVLRTYQAPLDAALQRCEREVVIAGMEYLRELALTKKNEDLGTYSGRSFRIVNGKIIEETVKSLKKEYFGVEEIQTLVDKLLEH